MTIHQKSCLLKDRLFVALDCLSVAQAEKIVEELGSLCSNYKIGYQLLFHGGLELAISLANTGKQIFLDLKLHDIPYTVEETVLRLSTYPIAYLSIHAYPKTMAAAIKSCRNSSLKLLAVTVMTSYSSADIKEAGYDISLKDLIKKRAQQARDLGIHGLVLSAQELPLIQSLGSKMELFVPGIRTESIENDDQQRTTTLVEAISQGATYCIVGRPIVKSNEPKKAFLSLINIPPPLGKKNLQQRK